MSQKKSSRRGWVEGSVVVVVISIGVWIATTRPSATPVYADPSKFESVTGVRIVRVAVTAGGGIVDLRYQALDPERAQRVHDPKQPLRIIDEESGEVLVRPWMNHRHKRELHTAVTYYQLLVNPGHRVKSGDLVTVSLGGAELQHVRVQ